METIAISKFKATCLAVLDQVGKTGRPVRITRFGKPVADVVPPGPPERPDNWLGCMVGTATIVGDITAASEDLVDWEATAK